MALRRQKQELEEKQANFQIEFERKLDEERTRLASQIGSREMTLALIEAEYKKIDDAQKANEDLRRKLDQGSQQLQGGCWSSSSSTCCSRPSSTTRSTR